MWLALSIDAWRVTAGEPSTLHVTVRTDRARRVRSIEGTLRMTTGGAELLRRRELLMPAGELPAGTSRFAWTITLPAETPPTHSLQPYQVECVAHVRVSRPGWWRGDAELAVTLRVRRRPPLRVERGEASRVETSNGAARLAIVVPGRRYALGERIEGSLTVHGLTSAPRELEILLVPQFITPPVVTAGFATVQRMGLSESAIGTPQPFRFSIPAWVAPSYRVRGLEISWAIKVRVPNGLSPLEATAPVEIVDEKSLATLGPIPEAETPMNQLAAREDLAAFASRGEGWEPDDSNVDLLDDDGRFMYSTARGSIVRKHGPYTEHLTCVYRYDGDLLLLIVLEGPSLGLDLNVRSRTRFRAPRGRRTLVGNIWRDHANFVTVRSLRQALPPVRAVVPTLHELSQLGFVGVLVSWTDTRMIFELPVRSLPAQLAAAAEALARIRRTLDAARALVAPPNVDVDLGAWRELARSLEAEPVVGDLTIRGHRDGTPVGVSFTWDAGRGPTHVNVVAGDPSVQDELGVQLVAEHVSQLPSWVQDVDVQLGVARARLVIEGRVDVGRTGELVDRLCRLVAPATLYR